MATVYKRGQNWWIAYFVRGKRIAKNLHVTKKSGAEKHKALVEAQLIQDPDALAVKNCLVDVFWERYSAWAKDHKRPSSRQVEGIWWRQLMGFCNPKRLGDVKPRDIEAFKVKRLADGLEKVSVNDALKHLQALFNYAVKLGFFSGPNPVKPIERYKIPRTPPKFLTDEELDRLLELAEAYSPSLHMYVALGALAGFRRKEIACDVWEWFDFEHNRITLESCDEFELKDSESRTLPMFTKLREILEQYHEDSGYVLKAVRANSGLNRYRVDHKRAFTQLCEDVEANSLLACAAGKSGYLAKHLSLCLRFGGIMAHGPAVCAMVVRNDRAPKMLALKVLRNS